MEAKDTVMSIDDLLQAGIDFNEHMVFWLDKSFKAGVKQHSATCELDYEAGIREVVGELTFYNEGITLAQLFATNQFQAKLKGWGV